MFSPVVLQINGTRQILPSCPQSRKQSAKDAPTHFPASHSRMPLVWHLGERVHRQGGGAARRLPAPVAPLVALPGNSSARAHGHWHARFIKHDLVHGTEILSIPFSLGSISRDLPVQVLPYLLPFLWRSSWSHRRILVSFRFRPFLWNGSFIWCIIAYAIFSRRMMRTLRSTCTTHQ